MSTWYEVTADRKHIAKEREKARELRKSQWWRDQINRGLCHYCEKTFAAVDLTMDHVVPVARGGRSTKSNIVPSCKDCNYKKKLSTPVELLLAQIENAPHQE